MASVLLFQRSIRVIVDTIEITSLDMSFSVTKTLKPEPNTAELRILNLNEKHRSALEQLKIAPVLIEAGYKDATTVLFVGDLRTALSVVEGANIVTALSSGDGEHKIQTSRVNKSIAKATPVDQVIRSVAEALGVGKGNLDQAVKDLKLTVGNMFSAGTVIYGNAAREMTQLCRSAGLSWSVQDGKLQILPIHQVLDGEAVLLSPSTGLVGSPTVDNKGVLNCRMLMIPDVIPGRKLVLDAKRLKGQYRIESTKHSGDTAGGDWYIDIEAKTY